MSLLALKDVSVRFGGVTALDSVSLELNRGEILGLIGPNGAGKTTLFNVITGVIGPTGGTVHFDKKPLRGLRPHQRARLGIARTFQNLQLFGSMTVLENVKVPIDALGRRNLLSDALASPYTIHAETSTEERAMAMLHVLDLMEHADTLAADLPVGVQRRVEIARALAMRPRLLLLDEPAAGLDGEETARLVRLLQTIRERFQLSMLLVDHDMSLVMEACDYLYVLDFGRLLARGRPEEVRDDPKVIAAYLGQPSGDLEEAAEEVVAAVLPTGAPLATPGPTEAARPLLAAVGLGAGYGDIEVVRDVNLFVRPGEIVACIGANGAGKTTTLRAISGVIRARHGQVLFGGEDITNLSAERIVRRGLVHIPQGRGLFPKLTVEETLKLARFSRAGEWSEDLVPAYDVFPKLAERRRQLVGTLSGGEQQMVAIARALLVRPRLLLIDEMSQGLAPTIVQQLFRTLDVFKREGIAVLLVEQFVDSALDIADRAYVFEQGTIAHEAAAAELRRDRSRIAQAYLGAAAPPAAVAVNGNGHKPGRRSEVMEEFMLALPADLLRALQERASTEGRTPAEVAREMLEGAGR